MTPSGVNLGAEHLNICLLRSRASELLETESPKMVECGGCTPSKEKLVAGSETGGAEVVDGFDLGWSEGVVVDLDVVDFRG